MSADTHPWTLYNHFITALCLRKKPSCWQTAHCNDKTIKMPTHRLHKFGYILPHGHCYTCDQPQPAQPIIFLDSTQSPGMPCAFRIQILWKCNFFLQPLFKIWNQLSKRLHSEQPSANLGEHPLSWWWPEGSSIRVWCCSLPWMPPHAFQSFTCSILRPIMTSTTSLGSRLCCQKQEVVKIMRICLPYQGSQIGRGEILHAIYNQTLLKQSKAMDLPHNNIKNI